MSTYVFALFMNVCVFGLWHLGCVTAACVSERFPTIGLDPDPATIAGLNAGAPPLFEPGLADAIRDRISSRALRFTDQISQAASEADVIWVTFDTPVDEDDRADSAYVEARISELFPYLRPGAIVLISSQLPVGSTRRLEAAHRKSYPDIQVDFAYSPENLRLGRALEVFRNPGRIIAGVRTPEVRDRLRPLLEPFCDQLVWMSVESAEMTKHALNAFLATSIVFINEIATLCEEVGADAKEVSQGLKTDERIGPRAYLGAGGPFAGGTLARDVSFLTSRSASLALPSPLLESIRQSNDLHKNWPRRKLESVLGRLEGKTIAVLGLTYKPGTSTLRRSAAIELCRWLCEQRACVRAFDPAVTGLSDDLKLRVALCGSAIEAATDADAALVLTEWPVFRELRAADLVRKMRRPVLVDANRFLEKSLPAGPPLRYITVGAPEETE